METSLLSLLWGLFVCLPEAVSDFKLASLAGRLDELLKDLARLLWQYHPVSLSCDPTESSTFLAFCFCWNESVCRR